MTNVFRPEYRALTAEEKARVDAVKDKAQELLDLIQPTTEAIGRETSIARTKLEESVMWAVKGITK